jgi:hypothetical protein
MEDRSEAARALGVARTERKIAALERIANMAEARELRAELSRPGARDSSRHAWHILNERLGARIRPLLSVSEQVAAKDTAVRAGEARSANLKWSGPDENGRWSLEGTDTVDPKDIARALFGPLVDASPEESRHWGVLRVRTAQGIMRSDLDHWSDDEGGPYER